MKVLMNSTLQDGCESLVTDLVNEKKVPSDGTFDFAFEICSLERDADGEYIRAGIALYVDGPLVAPHNMPAYRYVIYAPVDWSEEHIFTNVHELWRYLRTKLEVFKRLDYVRINSGKEKNKFELSNTCTFNISRWAVTA